MNPSLRGEAFDASPDIYLVPLHPQHDESQNILELNRTGTCSTSSTSSCFSDKHPVDWKSRLTYAAEHITSGDPTLALMVGVDTQVFHGFVRCGAVGAITGVGNALPKPVLRLMELCEQAARGDAEARRHAEELDNAMRVLSTYDEGPDLVLYYKYLMVLEGNSEYEHHINEKDGRFGVNQVAPLVKENCVAVAINGHMLYWLAKTDGADGEFIKANRHPSGGNCFVLTTPSGTKLAGGSGGGGAREALTTGLKNWKLLSDEERKALPPGKEVKPPEAERCTPPPGGLILRSFARNLKKDGGELARITRDDLNDRELYPGWTPVYAEPAHFNVWFTEAEWKSLVPAEPKKGVTFPVPDAMQKRLFRYHLVNGTFGLPGSWSLEQIRTATLTLTVEEVAPVVRMRLQGAALLTTDADPAKAQRGFDLTPRPQGEGPGVRGLNGRLTYDRQKKAFTRFDIVATGDYWGGDYEGGRFKRPGRTPLGISFELVRGDNAIDRVPPLVHMDREQQYRAYFAAEKKR